MEEIKLEPIKPIPKIQPGPPSRLPDEAVLNASKQSHTEVPFEDVSANISDEGRKLLEQQQQEDAEREANHFTMHPEQPVNLREAGPEIEKFDNAVALFEATHSLAELYLIVDISSDMDDLFTYATILDNPQRIENDIKDFENLNPAYVPIYKEKIARLKAIVLLGEEKRTYEIRRAAVIDLIPIKGMLDTLKKETNISVEQRKVVEEKYKRLTSAVGGLHKGKIDHDR